MKKGLIIAGGIFAVLVAVVLIAPGFIDWNSYRPEIAAKAKELTGRDVEIGEISFRILPSPALSAANVSIANLEGGAAEHFVVLKSLDIRVALLPLITGDIQVESIILDGPVIALERLADGRENWLLGEADSDGPDDGGRDIQLDRFVIQDGVISYFDAMTGLSERMEEVAGTVTAQSIAGPFEGVGQFAYQGVEIAFDGVVGRMETGRRTGVRLDLVLAGLEPGLSFTGTVLAGDDDLDIAGRIRGGATDFRSFMGQIAQISGTMMALPPSLAQAFELDAAVTASRQTIEIKPLSFKIGEMAGEGSVLATLGDQPDADIALNINSLKLEDWLSDDKEATDNSAPDFALPGDVAARFDLSVNAIEYKDRVISQTALKGELADGRIIIESARSVLPGGADITLTGALTARNAAPYFSGTIRAGASNLRGLLSWLDIDVSSIPRGQLTNFSLQSGIEATDKQVRLTRVESQLDISKITGDLTYNFQENLDIILDANINRINLDAYFPPVKADPQTWDQQVQSLKGNLKVLADMAADFGVRVDQATWSGAQVRNFSLKGSLQNGAISLEKASFGSYRGMTGSIIGSISNLAADPGYDLTIALKSANPAAFARWAELELPVRADALGPLDIRGKISGTMADLALDIGGDILGGTASVSGTLDGLNPEPSALDLVITLDHSSHIDLLQRLDQADLLTPAATRPVRIGANITGSNPDYSGTITADILGGNVNLDGNMTLEANGIASWRGTISASHSRFRDLMQSFIADFTPVSDRLGPFRLTANVSGSPEQYEFSNIDGLFGPTAARGSISADLSGAKPVIQATITADDIPADAYMPPVITGAEQATQSGGQRWSREPLGAEFLRDFDGSFTLKASSLSTRGYHFTSPSLAFDVKDGVLTITDLSGGLFGGQAVLTGAVDARTVPRLNASIRLSNASLERLLQTAAAIRPATGTVSFEGTYSAEGNSQYDLMAALTGQGTLSASNGVIRRINIPRLSDRMATLNRLPDFLALLGSALTGGETAYNAFSANLAADQGTLTIGNLLADIDGADVTAEGQINLADWQMNAGGSLSLKDHPTAPPIGVNIAGDVDNPRINFRTDAIKAFMGRKLATAVFRDVLGGNKSGGLDDLTRDKKPEEAEQELPRPGEALLGVLFRALAKKKPKEADPDPPN